MRQGVGAGFPHRGQHVSVIAQYSGASAHTSGAYAQARTVESGSHSAQVRSNRIRSDQVRSGVARFFIDLRNALQLSPHQAAAHLMTRPDTIDALESGHVEYLPPWPETSGIVMTYAAMANIDGRPVLKAISALLADAARAKASPIMLAGPAASGGSGYARLPAEQMRRARTAFANGAKRLPRQVRERPERAFYAVSLPLGLMFLALNTSVLSHAASPLVRMTASVGQYMRVHFAPVREGHRWIEVDDPRSRRGDKLRVGNLGTDNLRNSGR